MQPIIREYSILFNAITDTLKSLKELEEKLEFAQQLAEDIYIEKFDATSNDENSINISKPDTHI